MITIDYKRLNIRSGDRILDIGCGPGRHVSGACAGYEAVVIGADRNIDDLKSARENICLHEEYSGKLKGRWGLSAADITALPFPDHAFDHVICAEVMEHIPDDRGAAGELFRVLRPGGTLTVSVPRYLPEKICWKLSDAYHNTPGGHVRIYRREQITSLFGNMGLTHRFHHFAHSIHTPYWWLKCFFGVENASVPPVALYHRFLTWDIMSKPKITRVVDNLFNPIIGKSLVLYFRKN